MIIYKAVNKINGKSYIGQTKDFNKRKSLHKSRMIKADRNHYFYNAKEYREKLSIAAKKRCDNEEYKRKFIERMKRAKDENKKLSIRK